jgi:exonuclease 3'-5' domain-containing protein 1
MATQTELVDTPAALQKLLDSIHETGDGPPSLYIDLEGNNLSRYGTLSLVTILVEPEQKVYFVDVTTLQNQAFDTAGSNKRTLRQVLEANNIVKVFFDIRNDSDALFSLYGVRVGGIEDLQLMELASRTFNKSFLCGLARCVERDSTIGWGAKQEWKAGKETGVKLFDPKYGGNYAVFDQRPLPPEIHTYCVQDVALMPHLRTIYRAKLCAAWWTKIKEETKARIRSSQSVSFDGKGRHMARAPVEWLYWRPTKAQQRSRLPPQPRPQPPPPPPPTTPSPASTLPGPAYQPLDTDEDDVVGMLQSVRLTSDEVGSEVVEDKAGRSTV